LLLSHSTSRSVSSGDTCELLRHLKLERRRRGCRGGRRSTRRGTSLYNNSVVVGRRTHCRRVQSEVRPAVLVRPAVECSAVRSDAALDHNSELIADVSSPLIQCLPPDSAATVQQPLQLPSCRQELYLMSTPKASLSNVLHFHVGGPEEDLKAGEFSMDRQTSQASTVTLTAVDLSCSPVSLMSPSLNQDHVYLMSLMFLIIVLQSYLTRVWFIRTLQYCYRTNQFYFA